MRHDAGLYSKCLHNHGVTWVSFSHGKMQLSMWLVHCVLIFTCFVKGRRIENIQTPIYSM